MIASRLAPRLRSGLAGRLVAALLLLMPSVAGAVSTDGRWGLGFEQTLTGLGLDHDPTSSTYAIPSSGLAVHRFIGHWNLEGVVGGFARFGSGPPRWGASLSLGGHFAAYRAARATLSAGFRLVLGAYRPVDAASSRAGPLQLGAALELPLRAAFFLADRFMITGAVGPVAAYEPRGGNPLTGGRDGYRIRLFKGGFSGGLGFAFLFGG